MRYQPLGARHRAETLDGLGICRLGGPGMRGTVPSGLRSEDASAISGLKPLDRYGRDHDLEHRLVVTLQFPALGSQTQKAQRSIPPGIHGKAAECLPSPWRCPCFGAGEGKGREELRQVFLGRIPPETPHGQPSSLG